MGEKRESRFSIPAGLTKKRSEEQLRMLEQKIETLKDSLTNVEIESKSPSTGRTVKLGRAGRAPKEGTPMDSAFQSFMEVKESVNTRLQNMLREQQLLQDDIAVSTPAGSERSRSPKSPSHTFRIDDIQYQNLKQCKSIVDNLFDQEFQSIRKRNSMHGIGEEGGNLFSGDNLPSASVKIQRKILVEKICVMGQQLKDLESLEKI